MPKAKNTTMSETSSVSSQSNNVLYVMMAVITVFSIYLFVKVMTLEKKVASGGSGTTVQQESPLKVDNLKKYAKELKLNTGKFNKCLDDGAKKAAVEAQTAYGSSVGVQGTPGFFINGRFLAGAFPFEFFKEIIDKELAGTGSTDCTAYSTELQKYCSDPQNQAFNPVPKEVDVKNAQVKGPKTAKVTVVEFSDFECPFCIRAFPTVEQILKEYKNDVRFYFMQFPLTQIHPNAQKAAEASLCAADQGKFWEFHDKLFTLESAQ
ncbi:MAG: DSBA-like protein thioredoxin domain-containing protein [Microgenomates group bacterium GW2011_GWC2_46_7]|uniref:DSBA-like protein thioredoxin domain-containing protein n=1 Tax=Candidatus Roizmanbacteria bacterium GW2011_GWA2_35_8 TaxID=1618479 RepID=A0A0G0DFA7_9BACT|nr:MAG: DSBA-like protein thioredoxin domain-containing protein [Candidatus Roizmanbacteria bacterium GW2011_GWA2_35_8]KKU45270.1 MAG: DSBA-like protein thioredoxin domain-containing protein [Microgenomates group bacterium GW2011_GWC2_46_7]